jgi:hypothetical protein
MKNFESYLIMVGIRSLDFTFSDGELFSNIDHFKKCYEDDLIAYKALLFLTINRDNEDAEYGVDSRYTSEEEREEDGKMLMEERLKNKISEDQIHQAKLYQSKFATCYTCIYQKNTDNDTCKNCQYIRMVQGLITKNECNICSHHNNDTAMDYICPSCIWKTLENEQK